MSFDEDFFAQADAELTKHASIEAGIGPICAQKWGL